MSLHLQQLHPPGGSLHGQFKLTWQVSRRTPSDEHRHRSVDLQERDHGCALRAGDELRPGAGGYFLQVRDTQNLSPRTFLESQLFLHHGYLTARPSQIGLGTFTETFDPNNPTIVTGTYPNNQDRSTYRSRRAAP